MQQKNKVGMKRKRKDRTWAEAATLAIQMSSKKVLGIRPILHTIYHKKLKEISMNKAAENVLTTMLNHHAQLPNCPFFRVKGRYGFYALKEAWLKNNGSTDIDLSGVGDTDAVDMTTCADVAPPSNDSFAREHHTFAIQGKRAVASNAQLKKLTKSMRNNFRRKHRLNDSDDCAGVGSSRRHSSPVATRSGSLSRHVSQHRMVVSRVNSWSSRCPSPYNDYDDDGAAKLESTLDLETPNSILVNANMRTLVNRDTFALLPASYRYQLTGLLPECDRVVDSSKDGEHKVLAPSETAFTNEFFTQAVQEWRERLTDGEFTREAQSRIAQEIAKERNKIDPWKEKFFEEFYGQKQITHKRLRSRGTDPHEVRDFGMEAQLAKFAHLKPELQENDTKENLDSCSPEISGDDEDYKHVPHRLQSTQSTVNSRYLRTFANPYKKNRNAYADRIARTKLANSKISKLRSYKTQSGSNFQPSELARVRLQRPASANVPAVASASIVMKPSGVLSALARRANQNAATVATHRTTWYDGDESNGSCEHGEKFLHIRKDKLGSAILDHSYTSTPWQRCLENETPTTIAAPTPHAFGRLPCTRSSSTLVLCPRGNLVNSTIGNFAAHNRNSAASDNRSTTSSITTTTSILSGFPKTEASFKIIKPSNNSNNSDQERVLSICARPLTPETFTGGNSKPTNAFFSTIKRASPLLTETRSETSVEVRLQRDKSITFSPSTHSSRLEVPARETDTSHVAPSCSSAPTSLNASSATAVPATCPRVVAASAPSAQHDETRGSALQRFSSNVTTSSEACRLHSSLAAAAALPTTSAASEKIGLTRRTPRNRSASQDVTSSARCSESTMSLQGMASSSGCRSTSSLSTVATTSASPLVPGRLSIAGIKRSQAVLQNNALPGAASKWGVASSPSPPTKKTKTLAELKALVKAKKAANAVTGPRSGPSSTQPGAVAPNSHSHMFSAATFPVYFPLVTSSPSTIVNSASSAQHLPTAASYIRLPDTSTLPLERVQWTNPAASLQTNTVATCGAPTQTTNQSCLSSGNNTRNKSGGVSAASGSYEDAKRAGQERGKITLKIKAAGSAISLKVDADVINKELKRVPSTQTSDDEVDRVSDDEESSSNDSESDESDDAAQLSPRASMLPCSKKTHYTLPDPRIPSDPKQSNHANGTWSGTGSNNKRPLVATDVNKLSNANAVSQPSATSGASLLLPQARTSAVFGVSPYNVNVKPCAASDKSFSGSSLFPVQPKTSISFCDSSSCGSWSANLAVSADSSLYSNQSSVVVATARSNNRTKFKSISKGKSLKHMQELARSSMAHSDDSGEENADSSDDDDDHGDSTLSTTASENDKFTESDDSSRSWVPGQPPSPDSPFSDEAKGEKRPTQFNLQKDVKSRPDKSTVNVKLEPTSAEK